MTKQQLTPAQHAILTHAVALADGRINWFPNHLKGGARTKVLDSLFNRGMITRAGTDWLVAAEGYDALGHKRAAPAPLTEDPAIEAAVTAAEATWAQQTGNKRPRTRENSKQAKVIEMLRRPEGATVAQICQETDWQAHTVRGMFAGALKKKLGLTITSEKTPNGERVYRIA